MQSIGDQRLSHGLEVVASGTGAPGAAVASSSDQHKPRVRRPCLAAGGSDDVLPAAYLSSAAFAALVPRRPRQTSLPSSWSPGSCTSACRSFRP